MVATPPTGYALWMKGRTFILRGDSVTGRMGAGYAAVTAKEGKHLPSVLARMPLDQLAGAWLPLVAAEVVDVVPTYGDRAMVLRALIVVAERLHGVAFELVLEGREQPKRRGRPRATDPRQPMLFDGKETA